MLVKKKKDRQADTQTCTNTPIHRHRIPRLTATDPHRDIHHFINKHLDVIASHQMIQGHNDHTDT